MARKFNSSQLVLASHNKNKIKEMQSILSPYAVTIVSAADLALEEPEETGTTFAENALLKAHAAARASNLPALADDSGLVVHGLGGAPGVYSARWAGDAKDFNFAMERIRQELVDNPDRTAYFNSTLAIAWPDGHAEVFEGKVFGTLSWPPRGELGFGYDPIFQPDGYEISFAQMDADTKNRISHRALALEKFIHACFNK